MMLFETTGKRIPLIMGIVNVTPDSFSDGGRYLDVQAAVDQALRLEDEGADILDFGGESTRPGSDAVSADEELKRVIPVLEGLAGRVNATLSIDTRKAVVMREATAAGARIINDVTALTYDGDSLEAAAASGAGVVLMHSQGDPKTMQDAPEYDEAAGEIYAYLMERVAACKAAGIPKDRIAVDPGIGFGKSLNHNLEILQGLRLYEGSGLPVLVGASRKSMISKISGEMDADKRLPGSLAIAIWAAEQGARVLRVHDVAETIQALEIWRACHDGAFHKN